MFGRYEDDENCILFYMQPKNFFAQPRFTIIIKRPSRVPCPMIMCRHFLGLFCNLLQQFQHTAAAVLLGWDDRVDRLVCVDKLHQRRWRQSEKSICLLDWMNDFKEYRKIVSISLCFNENSYFYLAIRISGTITNQIVRNNLFLISYNIKMRESCLTAESDLESKIRPF